MSKKLTYKQTADLVGVPVGTVYCWVYRKQIPHFRLGGRLVRFSEEAIKAWLKKKEISVIEEKGGR